MPLLSLSPPVVVVVFIEFSVVQGYGRGSAARVALMFFCHHHKPVAIIFIAVRRSETGLILPHAIGRLASVNPVEELVQVMFQSCEPASLLRRGTAEQGARIIHQTRLLREVLLHRR